MSTVPRSMCHTCPTGPRHPRDRVGQPVDRSRAACGPLPRIGGAAAGRPRDPWAVPADPKRQNALLLRPPRRGVGVCVGDPAAEPGSVGVTSRRTPEAGLGVCVGDPGEPGSVGVCVWAIPVEPESVWVCDLLTLGIGIVSQLGASVCGSASQWERVAVRYRPWHRGRRLFLGGLLPPRHEHYAAGRRQKNLEPSSYPGPLGYHPTVAFIGLEGGARYLYLCRPPHFPFTGAHTRHNDPTYPTLSVGPVAGPAEAVWTPEDTLRQAHPVGTSHGPTGTVYGYPRTRRYCLRIPG